MTIKYHGPSSFNRWLFIDVSVGQTNVYCLEYNPEERSFEAFLVTGLSMETLTPAYVDGAPAGPLLRSLLPAHVLSDLMRDAVRRRR